MAGGAEYAEQRWKHHDMWLGMGENRQGQDISIVSKIVVQFGILSLGQENLQRNYLGDTIFKTSDAEINS